MTMRFMVKLEQYIKIIWKNVENFIFRAEKFVSIIFY